MQTSIVLTKEKIINVSEGFDRTSRVILIRGEPDKIFRVVEPAYRDFFIKLFQNPNLERLFQIGLVKSKISEKYIGKNGEMVIEHEKIEDINYFFEWSREMTKKAGIFLLNLCIELANADLFLKDSHAFNIVFSDKKLFFHDYGSIQKNDFKIGPIWLAAFFENFVFPVNYFQISDGKKYREFAVANLNRPFNSWRFFLFSLVKPLHALRAVVKFYSFKKIANNINSKNDQINFLADLKNYLTSLKISYPQTKWGRYSEDLKTKFKDKSSWDVKMRNFEVLSRQISPQSILDIGGNNGFYTRLFLLINPDVKKAILMDYDEIAVDLAHLFEKQIQNTYVSDFKQLTKDTVTYFKPYKKTVYPNFTKRNKADAVIMLALVHHLVYFQNQNFEEIAETLSKCSKKWILVEFVSNDDFHVKKWFKKGVTKKVWYTKESFTEALEKYFIFKNTLPSGNDREDRQLMLFEKKPNITEEPKDVAVVTTYYKEGLSPDEELSLKHLQYYLKDYDKFLIIPSDKDFNRQGFLIKKFPAKYFTSVEANAQLLFSKMFYEAFKEYKYVMIHELDALVLSNQMDYWVNKNYDLIGPPWIKELMLKRYNFPDAVGNGGFALRKVDSFLEALQNAQHPWKCILREIRLALRARRFRGLLLKLWDIWRNTPKRTKLIEDRWFSFKAKNYYPKFSPAPVEEGLKFGFEVSPKKAFELNGNKLPFGVHAWDRYDRSFWEPYLLK